MQGEPFFLPGTAQTYIYAGLKLLLAYYIILFVTLILLLALRIICKMYKEMPR